MSEVEGSGFGVRLRQLRERAGLTQEDLAVRAGVTAKGIAALERGRRQRPYPHTVAALADALGLAGAERAAFMNRTRPSGETPGAVPPAAPGLTLALPPRPATPIIGRAAEVTESAALIRAATRLLTLTGPGGIGKTRLALATAAELADAFPDGIAFVPLAPLTDPALVLPTIGAALGLADTGTLERLAAIQAAIGDRALLLILDNYEHLLASAPLIADLLFACPHLHLLVTSRAPLRLRGEREYAVLPLDLPDLRHYPTLAELDSNPAIALFTARAREVSPDFALTRDNALALATICRRLDGLPLALELAAARLRLLAPTELLARLDRALPLLAGGARDLPARQRTMRDTVAWSYDLLTEAERALFRQFAPFGGGWTLSAAEAVATPVLDGDDLLELLANLVEQSLVVVESTQGGESRYRLLEPIREFAREKLAASGEEAATQERHARYYLTLAERAAPELERADHLRWMGTLARENDNIRATMAWALAHREGEFAAALGWSLQIFWVMRGYHREGRRWLEQVLAQGPLPPRPDAQARAALGLLARMTGDYDTAATQLELALERFRALGDTIPALMLLSRLGHVARFRGDHTRARALAEEGLTIARAIGDRTRIVWMLDVLVLVAMADGEYARAIALAEEALALIPLTGDLRYQAGMQANLAMAYLALGKFAQAARFARIGLERSQELMMRRNIARHLDNLAAVAASRGEMDDAARLFGAAEATRESEHHVHWHEADRALYGPAHAATRAALGEAAFATAWEEGKRLSPAELRAMALTLERATAATDPHTT